jgi:hypothetical protein
LHLTGRDKWVIKSLGYQIFPGDVEGISALAEKVANCVVVGVAQFASVTPYPAYPGAAESLAYKVTVDGQPVFVHRLPTYNQFQWMDHASFRHDRQGACHDYFAGERAQRGHLLHPAAAYGIHPQISGNTISFDLDQPRYLVIFLQRRADLPEPRTAAVCRAGGEESAQAGRRQRGQHHGLQGRQHRQDAGDREDQPGDRRRLRAARRRRAVLSRRSLPDRRRS